MVVCALAYTHFNQQIGFVVWTTRCDAAKHECECEMYKRNPFVDILHMVYKYSKNGFDVMWKSSKEQYLYVYKYIYI